MTDKVLIVAETQDTSLDMLVEEFCSQNFEVDVVLFGRTPSRPGVRLHVVDPSVLTSYITHLHVPVTVSHGEKAGELCRAMERRGTITNLVHLP